MAPYLNLAANEIQTVLSKYALNADDYEPIEEGSGNSNYLVRVGQQQFVLTVFEIDYNRAVYLSKLLRLLKDYQFPTSHFLCSASGTVVTAYQGRPVSLRPYIAGRVVRQLDESMLCQVGTAMAQLHQIPSPDYIPSQHAYGLQTFPQLVGRGVDNEYENWLAQRYEFIAQEIPSGLPRGLIHGDVFYDNVLFEGPAFKALIDFEEACHYYQVFDLGMAIVGTCTDNSRVRLNQARSLVRGYQEIRVLADNEKKALQLFVEYAAVATSSWRFWKFKIDTPIPGRSDRHCEMVAIAKDASAIPKTQFMKAVFG